MPPLSPPLLPATSVPSDKTAGVLQLPDFCEDALHVTPLSVLYIVPLLELLPATRVPSGKTAGLSQLPDMSIVYFPLVSFIIAYPRISSANTSTFPLVSGSLPFTSCTLPRLSRVFFNCVLLFSSSVPPTAFFISSCIDFTVS